MRSWKFLAGAMLASLGLSGCTGRDILAMRKHPEQPITNYVNVESVDKSAAKVEKLGGKICMAKTAVPEMGYFVICEDTEGNAFALWERNGSAA